MTFKSQGFTDVQIQRARRRATRPSLACARALESGKIKCADHVTPERVQELIDKYRQSARNIIEGECDHNFSVWQRMNHALTGVCVGFLGNG